MLTKYSFIQILKRLQSGYGSVEGGASGNSILERNLAPKGNTFELGRAVTIADLIRTVSVIASVIEDGLKEEEHK